MNKALELHEMLNIGLSFEKELKAVGIETPKALRKIGSKKAFICLKQAGVQNMNINKLAALEGAIQNVKKYALDERTRKEIEKFYRDYEL